MAKLIYGKRERWTKVRIDSNLLTATYLTKAR